MRILPKKAKDEKEIESEGLFECISPRDLNSHGTLLREPDNPKQDIELKNPYKENESKEKSVDVGKKHDN